MPTLTLIAEATRRSEAVWVGAPDRHPRLLWHRWHDDALWLLGDGDEQPLPPLTDRALVTVRSRARPTDRVLTWAAGVERILPGTSRWEEVTPLLAAVRLNAPPGDLAARWVQRSTLLMLTPDA